MKSISIYRTGIIAICLLGLHCVSARNLSFSFIDNAIPDGTKTINLTAGSTTATFEALNNWNDNDNSEHPTFAFRPQSPQFKENTNGWNAGLQYDSVSTLYLPNNPINRLQAFSFKIQNGLASTQCKVVSMILSGSLSNFSTTRDDYIEVKNGNNVEIAKIRFGDVQGNGDQDETITATGSLNFVASDTLTFTRIDPNGDSNDVLFTAGLTIQQVPEPETYAFLLGLGALGFAAYRRRRRRH